MNRRSFSHLVAAPLLDAGVVAREEHVGDHQSPKLGGTGELGPSRRLCRETVLRKCLWISDDAGHEPGHSVDEDHRRDLAAAQHIVADRDLARGQPSADAIVDALVSTAHDEQAWLCSELCGDLLVEALAPWLHEYDRAWVVRTDRLHRLEHRLGLDDHPGASAERHVVNLPVAVVCEVAEVVSVKLYHSAVDATTHNTVLEHRYEHGGEDRDYVKTHLGVRYLASSTWTSQSATTTRRASRFTSMIASRVAGMRCSIAPSRLTHTSFAGRSRTSAIVPNGCPEPVCTGSPTTWWW